MDSTRNDYSDLKIMVDGKQVAAKSVTKNKATTVCVI